VIESRTTTMTMSEDQAEDAKINEAAARIEAQTAKVEAMKDSDPQKLAGRRILNAMRHNQAAAMVNRSMTRDDGSRPKSKSAVE
jgi:hypothetical protein